MANLVTFIEKEFILNQVQRSNGRAVVYGSAKTASCAVRHFDKETLTLEGNPAELEPFRSWESISAYLSYHGQRLPFTSKVRKIDGNRMVVAFPERLFKAPQRKSIRVPPPHGLKLEFFLQNERVRIDCPESQEYLEIEMPVLREGFDPSSMGSLLDSFTRKAGARYTRNGIVMFNKARMPETVEEKLVSRLGRVLLVASTKSPLPSEDPYPEGRIVTQAMADSFEGPSIFMEGSLLEKNREEKSNQGIVSEIYCPILYYQYVVGYIYLMNDTAKKVCLDFRAVDFAWEFARMLACSLKLHGYYKVDDGWKPDPHEPVVMDLSATGCLFVVPRTAHAVRLKKTAVIDIRIVSGDCTLDLKGRVARRLEDKDNELYGIAFLNQDPALAEALRTLLYADGSSRFACDELSIQD